MGNLNKMSIAPSKKDVENDIEEGEREYSAAKETIQDEQRVKKITQAIDALNVAERDVLDKESLTTIENLKSIMEELLNGKKLNFLKMKFNTELIDVFKKEINSRSRVDIILDDGDTKISRNEDKLESSYRAGFLSPGVYENDQYIGQYFDYNGSSDNNKAKQRFDAALEESTKMSGSTVWNRRNLVMSDNTFVVDFKREPSSSFAVDVISALFFEDIPVNNDTSEYKHVYKSDVAIIDSKEQYAMSE